MKINNQTFFNCLKIILLFLFSLRFLHFLQSSFFFIDFRLSTSADSGIIFSEWTPLLFFLLNGFVLAIILWGIVKNKKYGYYLAIGYVLLFFIRFLIEALLRLLVTSEPIFIGNYVGLFLIESLKLGSLALCLRQLNKNNKKIT